MKKIILCFLIFLSAFVVSITYASTSNSFIGTDNNLSYSDLDDYTYITSYSSDNPSITFLIPGLGGRAYHFSNDNNSLLTYDENSLIENLKATTNNGTVYLATGYSTKDEQNNFSFDFNLELLSNDGNAYIKTPVTTISYFDTDTVVVFESAILNDATNDDLYKEFNYVVDKISYNYYTLNDKLPKVNLIGYSRGGNIAIMYTNNHPFNVDSVYTINSPYRGTIFQDVIYDFDEFIEMEAGSPGAGQILNQTFQNSLHNDWEQAILMNPHINAHAIGGVQGKDSLSAISRELSTYISAFLGIENTFIEALISALLNRVEDFFEDPIRANLVKFILHLIPYEYLIQEAGFEEYLNGAEFHKIINLIQ